MMYLVSQIPVYIHTFSKINEFWIELTSESRHFNKVFHIILLFASVSFFFFLIFASKTVNEIEYNIVGIKLKFNAEIPNSSPNGTHGANVTIIDDWFAFQSFPNQN